MGEEGYRRGGTVSGEANKDTQIEPAGSVGDAEDSTEDEAGKVLTHRTLTVQ